MGTKHDKLTWAELAHFTPNNTLLRSIERYSSQAQIERQEIKILDWGCGRGEAVIWLREKGYDAYGVDIDTESIQNGIGLLVSRGHPQNSLSLLDCNGIAQFADGSFDFVFSHYVMEHVGSLEQVVLELQRVTKHGGTGWHIYPGHRSVVEPHLFMPFVHWLPKNRLRHLLILAFVKRGREPKWRQLHGMSVREKTELYYQYSIIHTFYRSYQEVARCFEQHGFSTSHEYYHPPLEKSWLLNRLRHSRRFHYLLNNQWTQSLIVHLGCTFGEIVLSTKNIYTRPTKTLRPNGS